MFKKNLSILALDMGEYSVKFIEIIIEDKKIIINKIGEEKVKREDSKSSSKYITDGVI